jgi:hypothetical protein
MSKATHKGQSLVEVVTGCLVMVPVALLVTDVVFVLNISKINADLALAAARMAANQPDETAATLVVRQAISQFTKPDPVLDVSLSHFGYDTVLKMVTVNTTMEMRLPVPLPGASTTSLTASSVQPIVGVPAAR